MNIHINDVRAGMTVIINNNLCIIQEFQHVKPGKGPAFVKLKFKNLKTGAIIEETFNTNIRLDRAHVEKMNMQYLYNQGDTYFFMNTNDYSQLEVSASILGDTKDYLKEGMEVGIQSYEGEIINIEIPEKVDYEIIETTDAIKGNTSGNAMKDATLETGLVVKVPLFISIGERVIITTRDGKYSSKG